MATNAKVLRFVRKAHLYIGLFIAPSLLFFAFTGSMQMLSLHDGAPGSTYNPPRWLLSMAQLHKNATLHIPADAGKKPPVKPSVAADSAAGKKPVTMADLQKKHLPMKIFFELVAVGLFLSTLSGIYMSYKYARKSWVITAWLVAGLVVPLLLTPF